MTTARSGPDGWQEHRREQMLATLRTTPTQRLRWLEAAIRFAAEVGALPLAGDGKRTGSADVSPRRHDTPT